MTAAQILHCEVRECLQDDQVAWRDNPFDCEAMPVQTETDNLQCTSLALLDEKIQAYQKERAQSCDTSEHDCRYSKCCDIIDIKFAS